MDNPNSLMATRRELAALREEFEAFRLNVTQSFIAEIERLNQRITKLENERPQANE